MHWDTVERDYIVIESKGKERRGRFEGKVSMDRMMKRCHGGPIKAERIRRKAFCCC